MASSAAVLGVVASGACVPAPPSDSAAYPSITNSEATFGPRLGSSAFAHRNAEGASTSAGPCTTVGVRATTHEGAGTVRGTCEIERDGDVEIRTHPSPTAAGHHAVHGRNDWIAGSL